MSLFDVIKYPISVPPTPDQLAALPDDLYGKWAQLVGWLNTPSTLVAATHVHWSPSQHDYTQLLIKLIAEYDNELV